MPDGTFSGAANAEAAAESELVVLTVPFRSQSETLTNLKTVLRAGPVAGRHDRAARGRGLRQGDAACSASGRARPREQAAEMVPDGVRVVSGLHTVSAALLTDLDHALDEDVLVVRRPQGRPPGRSSTSSTGSTGLRGVHAGSLEMARIAEALTPLLISINVRHKTHAGIRITGL